MKFSPLDYVIGFILVVASLTVGVLFGAFLVELTVAAAR